MSNLDKPSLMHVYPSVLTKDKMFNALGQDVAEKLGEAFLSTKNANIYNRIAELPESLLDILAVDFNISWYDYDFKLETKRRVIAAAFSVHRHIGTAGALITAISAIWPNSKLEEWFEYGGDPYYFRVAVHASEDDSEPIDAVKILNTINLYKNERSWLESDAIVIVVTFNIVIETNSQSNLYHTPVCGTLPRWANHGSMENDGLQLGTGSESAVYSVRRCGQPAGL